MLSALASRAIRTLLTIRSNNTVMRIALKPTTFARTGQLYRVYLHDEILVDRAREPLLEACRALNRRGIRGRVEMYMRGSDTPCLRADISRAASLVVRENGSGGPRFVRRSMGSGVFSSSCTVEGRPRIDRAAYQHEEVGAKVGEEYITSPAGG